MDTRVYWIWLQQALGQGFAQTVPLLRLCDTGYIFMIGRLVYLTMTISFTSSL